MRISDWSSDVCSSDLEGAARGGARADLSGAAGRIPRAQLGGADGDRGADGGGVTAGGRAAQADAADGVACEVPDHAGQRCGPGEGARGFVALVGASVPEQIGRATCGERVGLYV